MRRMTFCGDLPKIPLRGMREVRQACEFGMSPISA